MSEVGDFCMAVLNFSVSVLVANVMGHTLTTYLKMPLITGYIIAGMICGPYALNIVQTPMLSSLTWITDLALAVIAFAAGVEFYFPDIRSLWRLIAVQTAAILTTTAAFVTVAVIALTPYIPFMAKVPSAGRIGIAFIAGAITMEKSPGVALAIIDELNARGPLTTSLLGITVASDVVLLIYYTIAASLTSATCRMATWNENDLLILLAQLVGLALCAYLIGKLLIFWLWLRCASIRVKGALVLLTGFGWFTLAHWFTDFSHDTWNRRIGLEPLLVCMVGACIAGNQTRKRRKFVAILSKSSPYIFLPFFTLTGASFRFNNVKDTIVLAVVMFGFRIIAIAAGSYISGRFIQKLEPRIYKYMFMTLTTQAGTAIGLASEIAHDFGWGKSFEASVLLAVVMSQAIGPFLTKYALKGAGEDHPTKHVHDHGDDDDEVDWLETDPTATAAPVRSPELGAVKDSVLAVVAEEASRFSVNGGMVGVGSRGSSPAVQPLPPLPVSPLLEPLPSSRVPAGVAGGSSAAFLRFDALQGVYRMGLPDTDITSGEPNRNDDDDSSDSEDDTRPNAGAYRRVKHVAIVGITNTSLGVARRLAPHANITLVRTTEMVSDELDTEMNGLVSRWHTMRVAPISLPPPIRNPAAAPTVSSAAPATGVPVAHLNIAPPVLSRVTSGAMAPPSSVISDELATLGTPTALSYVPAGSTNSSNNSTTGTGTGAAGPAAGGSERKSIMINTTTTARGNDGSPEHGPVRLRRESSDTSTGSGNGTIDDMRAPLLSIDTAAPHPGHHQRALSISALLSPMAANLGTATTAGGNSAASAISLSRALMAALAPATDTVIIMLPTDQWSYQAVKAMRNDWNNEKKKASPATVTSNDGSSRFTSMFSALAPAASSPKAASPTLQPQPTATTVATSGAYSGPRLVVMVHDSSFAAHFRRLDCWVIYAGSLLADSISRMPFFHHDMERPVVSTDENSQLCTITISAGRNAAYNPPATTVRRISSVRAAHASSHQYSHDTYQPSSSSSSSSSSTVAIPINTSSATATVDHNTTSGGHKERSYTSGGFSVRTAVPSLLAPVASTQLMSPTHARHARQASRVSLLTPAPTHASSVITARTTSATSRPTNHTANNDD